MKPSERTPAPVVGGSSLLVMFAVLCLTVFALLALSTVQAQQRLSLASARAVEGYYQADVQAESILAALRRGEKPQGGAVQGDIYTYTCPISETQQLFVQVQHSQDGWRVLRWQEQSTADWAADEGLELWDGQSEF